MKTIIAFSALIAVAMAGLLPPHPEVRHHGSRDDAHQVVLLKETLSDNIGLDSYKFAYELSDGQKRDESAQVETRASAPEGESNQVLRVRGSYSFVAEDGQVYTVNYVADENGFQPEGAHLPVAPVA